MKRKKYVIKEGNTTITTYVLKIFGMSIKVRRTKYV